MKRMIEDGMLIEKLLDSTKVVVLLFVWNVNAFIFNVIIMIKLDAELGGRRVKGEVNLLQHHIVCRIRVIVTMVGGMTEPKNQFAEHMRPVEVKWGLKGFQ